MLRLLKTNNDNLDFIHLVSHLDTELRDIDGDDNAFYAQYNGLSDLKHVVVAYHNEVAISCGAIKHYDTNTTEIKRMYTLPAHRGHGSATAVLKAIEEWTRALGYTRCILETGLRNPDAIRLYEKNGYEYIPNYGQYEGVANSRCFQKMIVT